MKRLFTLLTIILLTAISSWAQLPVASYMTPDVGSPGMNIYIEIIAPTDANGTFGADGRQAGIRVRPATLADTAKIVFSQPIVSWNGRLISVQAFINPVLTPNTWDWNALDPNYIVPIVVEVAGLTSAPLNFYIVQPQTLGDVSGNAQRVLGEGSLGRRSPRGAMIVDSLILGSSAYTVSYTDRDINTLGNQAFLPFVLLSKGPIVAAPGATNVAIRVDAGGGGKGNNGGIGGGGGGGAFRDRASGTSRGNDGGDGYVGGGEGGVNNILSSSGSWEAPGDGSGPNGASLNGVPPSQRTTRWEASGGGTGHPFGTSGISVTGGNDDDLPGGYGGGSGHRQDTRGGSGGYFSAGANSGSQNGGKPHGNKIIVPLAGGSGGASGNPQYSSLIGSEISGNGGGGGGAMRIAARSLENIAFTANGGDGQNGYGNAEGGSGSGGAISLNAKLGVPAPVTFSAKGGQNGTYKGGAGYLRWDSPLPNNIGFPTGGESVYRGFTTDTSMWVGRRHKITGSNAPDSTLTFYLYAPSTGWRQVGGTETRSAWDLTLDLPKPDTIFYFYAMRAVTNPATANRSAEPTHALSQAAANVFRIIRAPIIDAPDFLLRHFFLCEGSSASDTITFWVKNYGEIDLVVDFANASWVPVRPEFMLVSPTTLVTIKENDSVLVKIAVSNFTRANMSPSSTLYLTHNATNEPSPYPVQIQMLLATADLESYEGTRNIGSTIADGLYLGEICSGEKISKNIIVKYDSTGPGRHNKIIALPPTQEAGSALKITMPPPDVTLDMNESFTMNIELITDSIPNAYMGRYFEKVILYTRDCPDPVDTILVYADVMATQLELRSSGQFPDTKLGQKSSIGVALYNHGNRPATITTTGLSGLVAPFKVLSVTPPLPQDIAPGGNIDIVLEFEPTQRGDFKDTLVATTFFVCPSETLLVLSGRGVSPGLYLSKFRWDIDTVQLCAVNELDSFYLGNSVDATAPFRLKTPATLRGPGAAAWQIMEEPPADRDMNPGDSVKYKVRFLPLTQGTFDAEIAINTENAGQDEIVYKLHGAAGDHELVFTPDPLDFSNVEAGFPFTMQMTITNIGWKPANIASVTSVNPGWTINPTSFIIPPYGGSVVVDVSTFPTETSSRSTVLDIDVTPGTSCNIEYKRGASYTATLAEIDTTKNVNFGALSPCDSSVATAFIDNIGTTRIVVLSHEILGADAAYFIDETPAQSYPDTLSNKERIDYRIKFKPRNSTDGPKAAILRIKAMINGIEKTIDIELSGVMQSGLATFPNTIEFGTVIIGSQNEQTLVISNSGPWDIALGAIVPPSLAEFVIYPADFAGRVLQPGDTAIVRIRFTSLEAKEYTDTIRFNLDIGGCPQLISIGLHANNIPGKELVIWAPQLVADPRDDHFEIPIYAKFKKPADSLANFTIDTLELTFNRSLFYPRSVDPPAQIISKIWDNFGNLSLSLSLPSLNLSATDSVVTTIRGNAMLGDEKSTPLTISKLLWSERLRVTEIDTLDGSMTIEICEKGGDRLLERVGSLTSITVAPNPSSDGRITIEVAATERGAHKLDILSVNGEIMPLSSFMTNKAGETVKFEENIGGLASGIYALRLTTPSEVKYLSIMIVK
ncbi:MAG: hypothetical protein ACM3U1_04265 [Chloroflexota bacterium]